MLRRGAAGLTLVAVLAAPAAAQTIQCLTLRGPCAFLDTAAVLLPRDSPETVLVANFGLITADPSGQLRYSCEAALGGLAIGVRMSPSGVLFVAGDEGVIRRQGTCGGRAARGDVQGRKVLDLAFDQSNVQANELRLWALSADALYLSGDGGSSFVRTWAWGPQEQMLQLLPAPSRPDRLFAAGQGRADGRLLVIRSDDGGRTFAPPGSTSPPGIPLGLLGVNPDDAEVLFVGTRDDTDQVWRSADGGQSWSRSLALPPGEALAGFTFAGASLFVAGRAEIFDPTVAPAHLYRSDDGGQSWAPGIPSGADGPRYRCLGFRAGRLYACAGGAVNDDAFLLGSSSDRGKSWAPLMTTQALAGPQPCQRAACASTTQWLCDGYGLCGDRPDAGETAPSATGCHCTIAGHDAPPAVSWFVAAAVLSWAIERRRSLLRRAQQPAPGGD